MSCPFCIWPAVTLLRRSNGGCFFFFFTAPTSAWAAEVWRHASCSVFHLRSRPLPQVSGHTLDQARPHGVEEPVPITAQCSIKPGWADTKSLSEAMSDLFLSSISVCLFSSLAVVDCYQFSWLRMIISHFSVQLD